jgi:adenosyl cobinamide kinase/adenosyl cobinamide phosphate guanylyltransferase
MGADLVAGKMHAADYSWPRGGGVVDVATGKVVPVDEECGSGMILVKKIEHMWSEHAGAVVKRECD